MERKPELFDSPESEIAYLREQLAVRERGLAERSAEVDNTDIETIGKQTLREYGSFTPKMVLEKDRQLNEHETSASLQQLEVAHDQVADILHLAQEKGIYNALTILEKHNNPHLTDEVHRQLVLEIRKGMQVQEVRENSPLWNVLHMSLFEVTLPSVRQDAGEQQLAHLVGSMQQWCAGLQTILADKRKLHYVLEIAVAEHSEDIIMYVAIPDDYVSLFEKQTLSLFPHAQIIHQQNDYNIFVAGGETVASVASLKRSPVYPLRTQDSFLSDPLAVLLNSFSQITRDGGGAAVQIVVQSPARNYSSVYRTIIERVRSGMKPREAIERSSIGGEVLATLSDFMFTKKNDPAAGAPTIDQEAVELFQKKISQPIVDTAIRVLVSHRNRADAEKIKADIEATFHQFALPHSNEIIFQSLTNRGLRSLERAFSFREQEKKYILPLNLEELTSLVHFPSHGIESSPQFKQSHATTASAPVSLPSAGTLLGRNVHRNVERDIYVSAEDRLRHFYIIGQTGTGKTVLMKNMILQDILSGAGVCFIDPHGTDIDDVLSAIPTERMDDVIYFDPSSQDRVIGLNMLEYDSAKPEQKTFVVNELFSIFQKLYSANPESMGPMFEQYFRNAALLVMEDPESGNTMMDISRVLSDSAYRRYKLERAKNPVVVQFWRKIATQAGGEAALENVVPYIVSKIDIFTANDYLRPIIGQQKSTFNFRQIMDERKILLVNLSKGRLGDINANLIGMIIVGKILMAALSRVDDSSKKFPPFYLHMDEFQNVSTDSISAILSEARKYKLGLTIAHQFMAQLDPKIKEAVFGNVGSMAAFRVGGEDGSALEQQFSPVFSAHDLITIPNRNAYIRMLADGTPTPPFSMVTNPPPNTDPDLVSERIAYSTQRYGRDKQEVEEEIRRRY